MPEFVVIRKPQNEDLEIQQNGSETRFLSGLPGKVDVEKNGKA